jgi:hypothetical protein
MKATLTFGWKDRTNSGDGLLIYSKEDIGICRKRESENDIDETIWVEVHAKGHSLPTSNITCKTKRMKATLTFGFRL